MLSIVNGKIPHDRIARFPSILDTERISVLRHAFRSLCTQFIERRLGVLMGGKAKPGLSIGLASATCQGRRENLWVLWLCHSGTRTGLRAMLPQELR